MDILADYLRGRNYAFERIDGSIPGDQRQAAIDRFTTLPIEESFVFLLCTRAGGVGINLTVSSQSERNRGMKPAECVFSVLM